MSFRTRFHAAEFDVRELLTLCSQRKAELHAEREKLRTQVARLAQLLAAERLDPDAGPPGWVLCGRQWVRNSSGARPLCSVRPLASPFDPRPVRYEWRVYPLAAEIGGMADTALEAMEAADLAYADDATGELES